MNPQTCDFCQAEFDWTDDQIQLDLALRLRGFGLGASCPSCDEKILANDIRQERREMRRERDRARRERANG